MEITQAEKEDLPEVMVLIDECIEDMESKGIHQWDDQYPTPDIFSRDIGNKSLYIVRDNDKIIGSLVLTDEEEPEYKTVAWAVKNGKYLIVHRLAVHPNWQNKGIATKLMEYAEEFALANGFSSIRLDTYSKNPLGLKFYEQLGYIRCGEIFFPTHKLPFFCYEKILKEGKENVV